MRRWCSSRSWDPWALGSVEHPWKADPTAPCRDHRTGGRTPGILRLRRFSLSKPFLDILGTGEDKGSRSEFLHTTDCDESTTSSPTSQRRASARFWGVVWIKDKAPSSPPVFSCPLRNTHRLDSWPWPEGRTLDIAAPGTSLSPVGRTPDIGILKEPWSKGKGHA